MIGFFTWPALQRLQSNQIQRLWWLLNVSGRDFTLKQICGNHGANRREWNSNDASISLQRIIGFTRRRIGNTVDTLMGTGMIEIVTVLAHPPSQVSLTRMMIWFRHSRWTLPMKRSHTALALGAEQAS